MGQRRSHADGPASVSEKTRSIWENAAASRGLHFVVRRDGNLAMNGLVEGIAVLAKTVADADAGRRTQVVASARMALAGRVVVATPGLFAHLVHAVRPRRFFGEPELDRRLVVRASSSSVARAVLDEHTRVTVQKLAHAGPRLSYDRGEIELSWNGVERDAALLAAALETVAYLAVQGSETTPYR